MTPFTLNIRGQLRRYDRPAVMGIINATPDSFYSPSRAVDSDAVRRAAESMASAGADLIDIGAYSSRSGASDVSVGEETDRLASAIAAIRSVVPEMPLSVDTFRAAVARAAVTEMGADIINDISGGDLDSDMFATVASLRVPYIIMHMRGNPQTMQQLADYGDAPGAVTAEVLRSLAEKVARLRLMGVADIIVDPGFGFAKTTEQNFELLANLPAFTVLDCPILAGLSRKSMISNAIAAYIHTENTNKEIVTTSNSDNILAGTIAANMVALERGASILRVHDVAAARSACAIFTALTSK